MNTILAIETATSSCSVALRVNGDVVLRNEVGNNIHSRVLLGMIESVLLEAELTAQALDAVAVGQGPGSFTGLRIGVGVGQGLAFGANCPMIGVSSLDALALQASSDGPVLAGIDARMGEIYWCEYSKRDELLERVGGLRVTSPADVSASENKGQLNLVGNAWATYSGQFANEIEHYVDVLSAQISYPSAGALLRLAEAKYEKEIWFSAADFAPIYVRDDVAKKSSKPLPGRRP